MRERRPRACSLIDTRRIVPDNGAAEDKSCQVHNDVFLC